MQRSQSVRGRSQSVIKKSPRKPLKRSSLVDSHSEPNSISSPPISFKVLCTYVHSLHMYI